MKLSGEGKLLRIFLGEADRHEGQQLFEAIVHLARSRGLAGATVLRGVEGFGAHSRILNRQFSSSRRICQSSSRSWTPATKSKR